MAAYQVGYALPTPHFATLRSGAALTRRGAFACCYIYFFIKIDITLNGCLSKISNRSYPYGI